MATLLADVTSLLERSYGDIIGFGAGRRGGGKKATVLSDNFRRRGQTRSEGRILGYQQVIHNAELPAFAKLPVTTILTYEAKETLGLYKCL